VDIKPKRNMKKIFVILLAMVGLGFSAYSQNVVIQTNEAAKSQTKDDCAYRISGICTTEDIGGVEVSPIRVTEDGYSGTCVNFTNYNSFTVTVIYELKAKSSEYRFVGSIVLRADQSKSIRELYHHYAEFRTITRKL
jgi:hypothetical protein